MTPRRLRFTPVSVIGLPPSFLIAARIAGGAFAGPRLYEEFRMAGKDLRLCRNVPSRLSHVSPGVVLARLGQFEPLNLQNTLETLLEKSVGVASSNTVEGHNQNDKVLVTRRKVSKGQGMGGGEERAQSFGLAQDKFIAPLKLATAL
jgi:hypothetical protein